MAYIARAMHQLAGVEGEALKEAIAINKSLTALGDVIDAAGKKEAGALQEPQAHAAPERQHRRLRQDPHVRELLPHHVQHQ